MFTSCTVLPDCKGTGLGIGEQETYLSADKNTRVVLESYHLWKGIPAIISGGVDIHEPPGFHLLQKICFQGR